MNTSLLLLLAILSLSACSLQDLFEKQGEATDVLEMRIEQGAFYPPNNALDLVNNIVLPLQDNVVRLPVLFSGINKIYVDLYEVDKECIKEYSVVGYAAVEGHLDISKFKEKKSILKKNFNIIETVNSSENYSDGYLELPIENYGFYYLAFGGNEEFLQYHIFLTVTEDVTNDDSK